MARSDVESLAASIAGPDADTTAITRYYDDIIFELGRTTKLNTQATLIEATGASRYTLPEPAIRLLTVFYDAVELYRLSINELFASDPGWRLRHGVPFGYWQENEPFERFVVYPAPITVSGSVSGGNLGTGVIQDAITAIYTEDRADVPGWIELPIAVEIAARELAMESRHKDLDASALLRQLAGVLFKVVF